MYTNRDMKVTVLDKEMDFETEFEKGNFFITQRLKKSKDKN